MAVISRLLLMSGQINAKERVQLKAKNVCISSYRAPIPDVHVERVHVERVHEW